MQSESMQYWPGMTVYRHLLLQALSGLSCRGIPFAEDILCICLEHDEHVGQHVQYRDLELKVFSACLVAPSPNLGESFSENSMDAPICEPSSFWFWEMKEEK